MLSLNISPIIKSSQNIEESSQAVMAAKNEFIRKCQLIAVNKTTQEDKNAVLKMIDCVEKIFSHIGAHTFYMYNQPPVFHVEYEGVPFVTLKVQYNHKGYIEFHYPFDGRIIAIVNTTGIPMEETIMDTESAKRIVVEVLERFGTRNYNYQSY